MGKGGIGQLRGSSSSRDIQNLEIRAAAYFDGDLVQSHPPPGRAEYARVYYEAYRSTFESEPNVFEALHAPYRSRRDESGVDVMVYPELEGARRLADRAEAAMGRWHSALVEISRLAANVGDDKQAAPSAPDESYALALTAAQIDLNKLSDAAVESEAMRAHRDAAWWWGVSPEDLELWQLRDHTVEMFHRSRRDFERLNNASERVDARLCAYLSVLRQARDLRSVLPSEAAPGLPEPYIPFLLPHLGDELRLKRDGRAYHKPFASWITKAYDLLFDAHGRKMERTYEATVRAHVESHGHLLRRYTGWTGASPSKSVKRYVRAAITRGEVDVKRDGTR